MACAGVQLRPSYEGRMSDNVACAPSPINNLEYDLVTGALVTSLSQELSRRGCSQSCSQRLDPSRIKDRYGDLPRRYKGIRQQGVPISASCRNVKCQRRGRGNETPICSHIWDIRS